MLGCCSLRPLVCPGSFSPVCRGHRGRRERRAPGSCGRREGARARGGVGRGAGQQRQRPPVGRSGWASRLPEDTPILCLGAQVQAQGWSSPGLGPRCEGPARPGMEKAWWRPAPAGSPGLGLWGRRRGAGSGRERGDGGGGRERGGGGCGGGSGGGGGGEGSPGGSSRQRGDGGHGDRGSANGCGLTACGSEED